MTVKELQSAYEKDFQSLIKEDVTFFAVFPKERSSGNPFNKSADDDEIIEPGKHQLNLSRPFIYNIKHLPETYKGFEIRYLISSETYPYEFGLEMETMLTPDVFYSEEKIIQYAEDHADEICKQLNDYSLTFKDICDIIAGGDFEALKLANEKEREKPNRFFDDESDEEFI